MASDEGCGPGDGAAPRRVSERVFAYASQTWFACSIGAEVVNISYRASADVIALDRMAVKIGNDVGVIHFTGLGADSAGIRYRFESAYDAL